MSLTVKITALWELKVPLEGMCRFSHQPGLGAHIRCFLRHADNHQRHVSGRRLHNIFIHHYHYDTTTHVLV